MADPQEKETASSWAKWPANPVIGGKLGTVFDVAVLAEGGKYRMWASWRPRKSIALFESPDGTRWSDPVIVLPPNPDQAWEEDINRPAVLRKGSLYHMWYTGQSGGQRSSIGYARSPDGIHWQRMSPEPVLRPELPWEKVAVMCPHVIWDEAFGLYRMWYSGGEQYEPNAIGYAESPDGLRWTKYAENPIFTPNPASAWEQDRVAGAQVVRFKDWHYMFYIGFSDIDHAQIGIARSRDGVTNWERHPENPVIRPDRGSFDEDACYKPYALFDGCRWLLWYNGRLGSLEQIGLAVHEGEDLGFA